ncbi:SOS response-associated peptidase [Rapidithrix thailandica]|uniref:Abasic site processing protein n=1 Tax=Rapidithrix thailandica TaxID=413964 RepID=A0AAW9S8K7_9BACT
MCGRYAILSDKEQIEKEFAVRVDSNVSPCYNAAPGYHLPVITNLSPKRLQFMRWGLIPHWAKDPRIAQHTINARAETITEKASFKMPIRRQRCLVLTNGYFEWKYTGSGQKQPYFIYIQDHSLLAMAGLWDTWRSPMTGKILHSFSIISVPSNYRIEVINPRMPVILPKEAHCDWLSQQTRNLRSITKWLKPYAPESMNAIPISELVNSAANNTAEVLKPIGNPLYTSATMETYLRAYSTKINYGLSA